MKFTWALGNIPEPDPTPYLPLLQRIAAPEEESEVIDVLAKSAGLDSSLGDAGRSLQHFFVELAPRLWRQQQHRSLAVFHGERIIGASVFMVQEEGPFQLASGPCVLSEYRSRGLGSWLLQSSLFELQNEGLKSVSGICKKYSVLAKYLYPKFGGVSVACESSFIKG